ncbi:MAG: peptidylprolyl isomerase [Acidimicrobiales bacterium]
MNRFVAVVAFFVFVLAGCGVDRASEDVLAEDAIPASDDQASDESPVDQGEPGSDGDGSVVTPTPTTLAVPPPTTGVPSDVALSADFDGTTFEVTHGELNDVVVATQENQEFVDLVFGGVVPPDFTTGVLTERLVSEALRVELAAAGGAVTDADSEASKAALLNQVEAQLYQGQPDAPALAQALYEDVPYLPFLVEYQAGQDALSTFLGQAGAGDGPEVPCVRHILVETEAEGDAIITRLNGGEGFAELAIELSTGPSGPGGGDLGCADSAGYVPEFAEAVNAAEVGEFVGPVQTQFGWHVIVVEGFEASPVDGRTLASERLQERLATTTVDVDEKLGTWDPAQLFIIPASQ